MLTLPLRYRYLIGLLLVILMVTTREYHFASLHNLPGASWAVFFLAGFYLRSVRSLAGFLLLALALDSAFYFTAAPGNDFCLTAAYSFLLPAYSALWFTGRWFADHYTFTWPSLAKLPVYLLAGALTCEFFSSGGFYFFSGQFEDTTLTEFWQRSLYYFPRYFQSLLFYVGTAAVLHILFALNQQSYSNRIDVAN